MKKYIIIIAASLFSIHMSAQEFRTDESISSQIKNASAPGMVKSSEVKKAPASRGEEQNQDYMKQLRSNQLPDVKYKTGNEKGAAQSPVAARASSTPLTSDAPVQPAKKEEPVIMNIPSQDKSETK